MEELKANIAIRNKKIERLRSRQRNAARHNTLLARQAFERFGREITALEWLNALDENLMHRFERANRPRIRGRKKKEEEKT